MKITGYKLREALRVYALRVKVANEQFNDSLFAFPSEEKDKLKPAEVLSSLEQAETAHIHLQALQEWYNQQVQLVVQGKPMSLAVAIKMLGPVGRLNKLWRTAATASPGRDRWNRFQEKRNKEDEYATRQVSVAVATGYANTTGARAAALHSAIAAANTREITAPDKYKGLFDVLL